MVKTNGNALSDVGRQVGPSELFFANPNAVRSISATLRVTRAAAIACPANTTPFASMGQTILGGTYFNPGTGNPGDDVAAVIIVGRDPSTPPGVLLVQALVFSANAVYGFSSLGTAKFTVPRYTLYPTIPVLVLAIQERLTLCCNGATPLPVSDSVTGELPALLTNESMAVTVPDTCGRNVTVNCRLTA